MAAGVTTQEIIKMLLRRGHKITLVAPSTYLANDSSLVPHGGQIRLKPAFTAIPRRIARRSKFISMLVSTLGYISVFNAAMKASRREEPFDLIMSQHHTFHLASSTSLLLSKILKVPLVVKLHSIVPGSPAGNRLEYIYCFFLSKLNRVALSGAARVLTLSTEWSKILTNMVRLEPSRVVVFPSTVDLTSFHLCQYAKELRSRFGLDAKGIVLFIASAFEDRGLDVLFKAMHTLKDKNIMLLVVGPYDEKYTKLAQQLGVSNKVVFLGEVKHELIPSIIHMADVCVGPLIARSIWYGDVPTKVIEYMACGKPVIAARGSVTKDLIEDGISGVLVSSKDEKEIASAIGSLMNNASLSKLIGEEARNIITERFSSERLADRLENILNGSMLPNQS